MKVQQFKVCSKTI